MANQTTANALKGHDAEFENLSVAGDITVGGDFSYATDGDAEVGGDLTVTGSTTLEGTFGCNGATAQAAVAVVDLTDSTGLSGTHDDTLAATTVPADATGGQDPTEAEFNALLAVVRVMAQNTSDLAQKLNEVINALQANGILE